MSVCDDKVDKRVTYIATLALHRLIKQASPSTVGSFNRVEFETEDEVQGHVLVGDVDKIADSTKTRQAGLKVVMHQAKVVQRELDLQARDDRSSGDNNAKLALELIDSCSVLRLGKGEGVVVDIGAAEVVLLQDELAGTSILKVVEAEVDTPAIDGDAIAEDDILLKH